MTKGKFGHRHTQGEHRVKMKKELTEMLLQAKECQRLPTKHQELGGKLGTDCLSQPSEEILPPNAEILCKFQDFGLKTKALILT